MSGKGTFAGMGFGITFFTLVMFLPASRGLAQEAERERTQSDFFQAMLAGDTNSALRFLAAHTNLARTPSYGTKFPLHVAASKGQLAVVESMLRLGAQVDATGDTWDTGNKQLTALEVAVWYGHPAVAKRLLEAGANPNHLSPWDGSALHLAFAHNREEVAGWLLDYGANPFLAGGNPYQRTTALEVAIARSNGKLIPRMLGRADPSTDKPGAKSFAKERERFLSSRGSDALTVAAQRGLPEAVQALLATGVAPLADGSHGYSTMQSFALAQAQASRAGDFQSDRWTRVRELLEQHGASCDAFAATALGDLETARRLAAVKPEVANALDHRNEIPLHWAVRTDRLPFTSFWLEAGATPGATNFAGQTPLHVAAEKGFAKQVERLLAASAPTNSRDTNGWTPLDAAMQANQTETIRLLLASTKGPPLDRGITTTLHEAAASGNIVALTEFATAKNLEARNELGFTPLHLAAQSGQLGAAAFLLDQGADVNTRDPEGNTVLHLILLRSSRAIAGRPSNAWIERKKQKPQNKEFLRLFTATNDFHSVNQVAASVAFFLACGADLSATNKPGKTVLQIAMDEHTMLSEEDLAALLPLFSQGGNGLDARDENGETALHRAAREILGDNAEALIAAAADLNATNTLGRTPLHAAVEKLGGWGDSEPFTLILNAKPNVNAQDNEGLTPLHVLLLSESSFLREATEALLNAGANPNLRDKRGRTPLLCALAGEWPWHAADASLSQLVGAGAETDVADDEGCTALHYLARMGEQSPIFFIRGATNHFASLNVNATNRVGDTPLHVAARSGTSVVFDWLRSRGARLDVTNVAGETPEQLGRRNRSPFARLSFGLPAGLTVAAQRGEVETLDRALKADPSLLNATNTAGETALRIAARSGQTNLVADLIQQGAAWDPVSATLLGRADVLKELLARNPASLTNASHGRQLIHLAAELGDLTILEILLSAGADINRRARSGLSPLGTALMNRRDAAAGALRARGARENLFDAVVLDLPDPVAALLALEPSLGRIGNEFEFTAAHLAAALDRQAILKLLLDRDVPPGIPAGGTRISPLHVAAACNCTNAIALLVERGARTEVVDDSGCTPLHYAAVRAATESAAVLLALGAKPDNPVSSVESRMPIPSGNTALHFAVSAGRTNIVALLLQAGANVNATNALGLTPLDLTRPGMPMSTRWSGPLSSPGIKLAASFRSMGLPQLANLSSVHPARFGSSNYSALAAMLERAGGVFGNRPNPGWPSR